MMGEEGHYRTIWQWQAKRAEALKPRRTLPATLPPFLRYPLIDSCACGLPWLPVELEKKRYIGRADGPR
jgi:hypothetical protein